MQSVGGGGGFSGMSSGDNVILGGSVEGDSSGGSVNASNEASITTPARIPQDSLPNQLGRRRNGKIRRTLQTWW